MDAPQIIFKLSNVNAQSIVHYMKDGLPTNKSFVQLQNIRLSSLRDKAIMIDTMFMAADNYHFTNNTGRVMGSDSSYFNVTLKNIQADWGKDNKFSWSATIDEAATGNLIIDSLGKNKGKLFLKTAGLSNLNIETSFKNFKNILKLNPSFTVHHLNGYYKDGQNDFQWYNASFSHLRKTFSVDSFAYKPAAERNSFIAQNPYQVTYLTASTGSIIAKEVDINKYLADTAINIKTIHIKNPVVYSYRDKRPPFNANVFRPLPVSMIKNISIPFSIDTIFIHNGKAVYTELNDKTLLEGSIPITRLNATISSVRNYNASISDSLYVRAEGYLMDSAWMRLGIKESYEDSLAGFLMTLRMKPASLTFLNAALEPLASVRLRSGFLDTLSMRAVGREHVSLGEMKMFYHNLRVQFLKKRGETKRNLLAGLITFIANNFVIKRENRSETGQVYFPRLQNRSIFNYLVKMIMSGMASSVGAKQNKKMLKQYERELKRHSLPPIHFDE